MKQLCITIVLGAITLSTIQPAKAIELEQQEGWIATNSLNEFEPTTAMDPTPVAQADVVTITKIQIEEIDQGFTLQLETTSELPVPQTTITGDALIANIPNAVLQLDDFLVGDPAAGIALVTVTNLPDNQVQIVITGAVTIMATVAGLAARAKPGDVVAQPPESNSLRLVVTGEDENDYFVPNASTATRTDTPILETPASVQVIPRQVLEDQQVIRIEDALSNLSGVTFAGTFAGLDVDFNIRGFDDAPIFRDGFRQFGFGNDGIPELANLERIEVLRGPASILYGEIQPGGVINLVTKQPLAEPFYEAKLQAGNRGLISPSLDISGPLTSDNRLRYRLNALYRNEDSFRDFEQNIERFFAAPVLSWLISDRTDLTLQLEYSDYEGPFEVGLPAIGDSVADVPFSRIAGELDDFVEIESLNVGYNLEHRFSDTWKLRNAFRFTRQDILDVGAIPIFFEDESAGILSRGFSRQVRDPQDFGLQTSVIGEFATGSVDHTLLFGVDLNRSEERDTAQFSDFADFQPLNIFDPVYGTFDGIDPETLPIFRDEELERDRLGI